MCFYIFVLLYCRYVTSGTDRRGVASTDRSYSDSRRSDPDRRAPPVVADSRSRPVEDRYRSTATVDRRDYNTIRGRDSSRVDREKPTHHSEWCSGLAWVISLPSDGFYKVL